MQLGTSGCYAACVLTLQDGEHFPAKHSSEVAFSYPTPAWIFFCFVHLPKTLRALASTLAAARAIGHGSLQKLTLEGKEPGKEGFLKTTGLYTGCKERLRTLRTTTLNQLFLASVEAEPILDLMMRTKKRECVRSLCKTLDFDELCFLYRKRQTIHLVFINIKMQSKKGILG